MECVCLESKENRRTNFTGKSVHVRQNNQPIETPRRLVGCILRRRLFQRTFKERRNTQKLLPRVHFFRVLHKQSWTRVLGGSPAPRRKIATASRKAEEVVAARSLSRSISQAETERPPSLGEGVRLFRDLEEFEHKLATSGEKATSHYDSLVHDNSPKGVLKSALRSSSERQNQIFLCELRSSVRHYSVGSCYVSPTIFHEPEKDLQFCLLNRYHIFFGLCLVAEKARTCVDRVRRNSG